MNDPKGLRERVESYLRSHHTMTVATVGPGRSSQLGGSAGAAEPHAASVFYALDDRMRLIFLSKTSSRHAEHIGRRAPVSVTVSEDYADWTEIKGVQIWGTAHRVTGAAKVAAMASYITRFPFVPDLLKQPSAARWARSIAVYRVQPHGLSFTDNSTGVFGREALDLDV